MKNAFRLSLPKVNLVIETSKGIGKKIYQVGF